MRPPQAVRPTRQIVLERLLAAAALAGILSLASSGAARAQRPDSARATVVVPDTTHAPDTTHRAPPKPPLTPKRAFIYSAIAPGSAQSILGRPTAAAIFVATEAIALIMIRETGAELREARAFGTDSVLLSTDESGKRIYGPPPFPRSLVRSRQAHLEDWIAALLANHLFSGLDGYVAAQLWDVPIEVSVRPGNEARRSFLLRAAVRW